MNTYKIKMAFALIGPYLLLSLFKLQSWFSYSLHSNARLVVLCTTIVLLFVEIKLLQIPKNIESVKDKGIISGFIISLFLALPLYLPGGQITGEFSLILGIFLLFCGVFLRYWSMRCLGVHYSHAVQIGSNHELISSGPYRYIRHPIYTATILILIGNMLIFYFSIWYAILLLLLMPIGINRVIKEEWQLNCQFGDNYKMYMQKTKRFIPYLA